ncbi:hypothetical protein [uncultured Tenacibaculum sp.]|uniref:hypothetical protein n=1 Tax=uncultured Tenacibaculum sp. TaxID=174713 RepID=UPI002636B23B|nr:hypothetical protein [uncultured Tenacibaculum sp.]
MRKESLITILLHSLIVIGFGHGLGFLIFFDILSIPNFLKNGIQVDFELSYMDRLMNVGFISIIGKLILILGLFQKATISKMIFNIIGIILLLFAVIYLTYGNWYYENLHAFSFLFSIPFLIYSVSFFKKVIAQLNSI